MLSFFRWILFLASLILAFIILALGNIFRIIKKIFQHCVGRYLHIFGQTEHSPGRHTGFYISFSQKKVFFFFDNIMGLLEYNFFTSEKFSVLIGLWGVNRKKPPFFVPIASGNWKTSKLVPGASEFLKISEYSSPNWEKKIIIDCQKKT